MVKLVRLGGSNASSGDFLSWRANLPRETIRVLYTIPGPNAQAGGCASLQAVTLSFCTLRLQSQTNLERSVLRWERKLNQGTHGFPSERGKQMVERAKLNKRHPLFSQCMIIIIDGELEREEAKRQAAYTHKYQVWSKREVERADPHLVWDNV